MFERVKFDKISVDFPIYDANSRSLKHKLILNKLSKFVSDVQNVGGNVRQDKDGLVLVRALDDISFSMLDGDRIAVLGHNGSGKTTLLRVAAGIYEPLQGDLISRGRVMPLFNIMEGLTPDAKGSEMIRIRGALLGLSQQQIEEKTADIVEFSELGEYMEMPVRTYSTGMLVRLMFGITTAITSEILIMDEFIGAGDASFFERAQIRLKKFVDEASVLLVATHSPSIAKQWCNKAILLNHGHLVEFGTVDAVLKTYDRLAKTA
jgi:ABC-type polysaccharide/polyol phosphate transport system ATPase subunit